MKNSLLALLLTVMAIGSQLALPHAAHADLTASIKAYWKLDESSGNASDATGNGFTLTNTGTATYDAGLINNGVDFGTSNTSKVLGGSNIFSTIGGAFTINVWVKLNQAISSSAWNMIGSDDGGVGEGTCGRSNSGETIDYLWNSGTPELEFSTINATIVGFTVAHTLSTSAWTMLTLTGSGAGGTITGYINGTSVGTATQVATGGSGNNCVTGVGDTSVGDVVETFASAKFDEAGIWTRALTSAEITTLYNTGIGCQYNFNSGTGCAATPTSGFGILTFFGWF